MSDIGKIGSTAFVIAAIRANEPNQAVRLFNDPYARWFASEPAVAATKALDAAFPPATTMVRFRTRFFNEYVERGIENGARQVVLLGGGFDMRAHILADESVIFFEVDQAPVVDFKRSVLGAHGLEQPPSVPHNYLEADLPAELAGVGLELDAPTLVVWEGNTMYLPVGEVLPFLGTVGERAPEDEHRLRLHGGRPAESRPVGGGRCTQARGRRGRDARLLPDGIPRPLGIRGAYAATGGRVGHSSAWGTATASAIWWTTTRRTGARRSSSMGIAC